jgi:hypothetical protein
MLAQAGIAKSAAWRLETKGTVTATELDVLGKILTARVVELRRCADAVTKLVAGLPTTATVTEAEAEPKKQPAAPKKATAKKSAPNAPARRTARKAAAA